MKFHYYDENSSLKWEFLVQMKILYSDENLSLWWKSITEMKIYNSDESFSLWWNIITQLKSYHFDENWWLWLKFVMLLESHHFNKLFSTASIFHPCDENLCLQWAFDILKKIHRWWIPLLFWKLSNWSNWPKQSKFICFKSLWKLIIMI